MVHSWIKYTDGTGSTIRVVLFDYRKAFHLIDHTILAGKLMALDIPHGILCWIINFLKDRKQSQARARLQVGMGRYPGRGPTRD